MGATTFTQAGHGADINEAFHAAHSAAGYEHGHGYSGSLAEKDSYVITDHRVYPDLASAAGHARQMIDGGDPRIDDKWGPAGAVRYIDPEHSDGQSWLFFGWASC